MASDSRLTGTAPWLTKGWHRGVLVDAYMRGPVTNQYGTKTLARFVWEVEERRPNGARKTAMRDYTATLSVRSALRRMIELWRGVPFTAHELEFGFNPDLLIGRPAMIYVDHADGADGKMYYRVMEVLPMPVGTEPIKPEGTYARRAPWPGRSPSWAQSSPSSSEPSSEPSSSSPAVLEVEIRDSSSPTGTGIRASAVEDPGTSGSTRPEPALKSAANSLGTRRKGGTHE